MPSWWGPILFVLLQREYLDGRPGYGPIYAALLAEHGTAAAWGQTRWGDWVDGAGGHEGLLPQEKILYFLLMEMGVCQDDVPVVVK